MKPPLGLVLLGVFSAIAIVPALVYNLGMDKEPDDISDEAYEAYIIDCISHDGDAMMAALGFRQIDGHWRTEDRQWLSDLIDEHGIVWVYEQIKKSGLVIAK